ASDAAVEAVSQRTLLGSYVVPALRLASSIDDNPPAILPVAARRLKGKPAPRRGATRPGPLRTAVAPSPRVARAQPPTSTSTRMRTHTSPSTPMSASTRTLLLITFDAFDPAAAASRDAPALREIAERAFRAPLRDGRDVPTTLRALLGSDGEG